MAKLELGWENSKAAVPSVAISHILLFKFKLKKKILGHTNHISSISHLGE